MFIAKMFLRKKIDPKIDDIYWYASPKDFNKFTGKSESTFRSMKMRGNIITIYIPQFVKWDLMRYKRVYIHKKDLQHLFT